MTAFLIATGLALGGAVLIVLGFWQRASASRRRAEDAARAKDAETADDIRLAQMRAERDHDHLMPRLDDAGLDDELERLRGATARAQQDRRRDM